MSVEREDLVRPGPHPSAWPATLLRWTNPLEHRHEPPASMGRTTSSDLPSWLPQRVAIHIFMLTASNPLDMDSGIARPNPSALDADGSRIFVVTSVFTQEVTLVQWAEKVHGIGTSEFTRSAPGDCVLTRRHQQW